MTALSFQSFEFNPNPLRVVMRDGDAWFVAADVCAALQLETHVAVRRLDEDEKGRCSIPTLGGDQEATVINESGLYSLVLGSRKPEAKKFKKWVTGEVLPAIRRTGRYEAPVAVAAAPAAPALPDVRLVIALEAAVAEIGKLKDLLIGGQSQHIKTLNKLHTLQRRLDSRQACNTVIEMARRGETRERIEMATGLKKNYIRQLIFRAKRSGVLPKDDTTTQSAFGFEFSQQQYQGARHA